MKDRNEAERAEQQRKQTQKVTRILQEEIFFRNSYPREQKISNSKRKEQREESVRKDNREKTNVQREKKAGQTDDRGKKRREVAARDGRRETRALEELTWQEEEREVSGKWRCFYLRDYPLAHFCGLWPFPSSGHGFLNKPRCPIPWDATFRLRLQPVDRFPR